MSSTIEILLTYYDKAYLNSIEKRKSRLRATAAWDGKSVSDFASRLISEVKSVS